MREAKAQLSELLRDAKRGEETVITDHGTPVAKLVPFPLAERSQEEVWADLERRGLIGPRNTGPDEPIPDVFKDIPYGLGQKILQEHRGE